jgi:hypothetical protein
MRYSVSEVLRLLLAPLLSEFSGKLMTDSVVLCIQAPVKSPSPAPGRSHGSIKLLALIDKISFLSYPTDLSTTTNMTSSV